MKSSQESNLRAGLQRASRIIVVQYLRYRGLPAGTNDTKKQIIDRVLRYIKDAALTVDAVWQAVIDFEEHSNKSVFLLEADPEKLRTAADGDLPERVPDLLHARIRHAPAEPVVSYSYVDELELRISFSEVHSKPHYDYDAGTIDSVPLTKVIALTAELETGFVALRLDPPEVMNPHKGSVRYHQFYVERAMQILGCTLSQFSIDTALLKIEQSDLVRLPYGRMGLDDGRVDLQTQDDYRHMDVYGGVWEEARIKQKGRYIWLKTEDPRRSGVQEQTLPVATGLLRDIPTDIYAGSSMVRFTKDVLPQEVEYVVGQIRAHA